jgi:hypothetical protein
MIGGISVPMKQPKGPSALENAMELISAGMNLGMSIYGAKNAFSAQQPPSLNAAPGAHSNYNLNTQYSPRIKPMFTGE